MCLEVFVASEEPLPIVPTDNGVSVFQTESLWSKRESVRRLFSKPHIGMVTAVGCACGFRYALEDLAILTEEEVPEEIKDRARGDYAASRESVARLKEFLRHAAYTGSVEIYSCWAGDAEAEPESRRIVTLDHFGGEKFAFTERQFLTVHR